MSELSILELETEHAELLPERETLNGLHGQIVGGYNHLHVTQIGIALAKNGYQPSAVVTNTAYIAVG
jgi:hypothetical protein